MSADHERDYYRAEGPSKALVHEYMEAHRKATIAAEKLAAEFGAHCCIRTRMCKGFVFNGQIPPGLGLVHRKLDPDGWVYPDRSAKGKALAARLGAITFPDGEDVAIKLMGKREWVPVPGKTSLRQIGPEEFRRLGDDYYLAMAAGVRAPKHCTLIKRSEFWALVEAEEAKKAKKKARKTKASRALRSA